MSRGAATGNGSWSPKAARGVRPIVITATAARGRNSARCLAHLAPEDCERNASHPGPPKDHACTGEVFLRSPVTCGAQNYVIDYHCAQKTLRLITLGSAPSPGIVPVISGPLPWIVPATGES